MAFRFGWIYTGTQERRVYDASNKRKQKNFVCGGIAHGAFFMAACAATPQQAGQAGTKMEVARISPQDAHPLVRSGQAILVCAYENEQTCSTIMLEGAISMKAFRIQACRARKRTSPSSSIVPDPTSILLPVRQKNTWQWDIPGSQLSAAVSKPGINWGIRLSGSSILLVSLYFFSVCS